jgi:prepilin-type N-terminal cleavage/methylation domain-containing protein
MKRRAFTIVEILVALLLLGTLTAVCLQFFAGVIAQRREQSAELSAAEEAANIMERLAAVAWDDLPKQSGEQFSLSAQLKKVLPEGRVEVKVNDVTGPPPARRIAATVFWRPQPGEPERKARVVAWRCKQP